MRSNELDAEVEIPEDLAEAIRANHEAAAIWDRLPAAHRHGHVIAIEGIADGEARTERVEHTVDHLLERHAS
jgi:uncharacterized protein YdeI (YjbR/CyaY-like superfamily)